MIPFSWPHFPSYPLILLTMALKMTGDQGSRVANVKLLSASLVSIHQVYHQDGDLLPMFVVWVQSKELTSGLKAQLVSVWVDHASLAQHLSWCWSSLIQGTLGSWEGIECYIWY